MATTIDPSESIIPQINESSRIHYQELDEIVSNTRWLASIVLAEIAGLAAYRDLQDQKSLSIPLVLVVLLLSITLAIFIFSAIISRIEKRSIGKLIMDRVHKINEIKKNDEIAPKDGEKKISYIVDQLFNEISKKPEKSRMIEIFGLGSFIFASLMAALILFFTELRMIFC